MQLPNGFSKVTTFAFDMDGVLTDGTAWVLEERRMIRRMSIKDGYALQLAIKKGFNIVVISGSTSPEVTERLKGLGITDVYMGVHNKVDCLQKYLSEKAVSMEQVLFMGDDVPDLPALKLAGLSCAPADAVSDVKEVVHYISTFPGGMGCVRDVIEKALKIQDRWELNIDIASR